MADSFEPPGPADDSQDRRDAEKQTKVRTDPGVPRRARSASSPDAATVPPTAPSAPPDDVLPEGELLSGAGSFTRGGEIAHGGMGKVSYAYDHALQRQVAVKELHPTRTDAELKDRFLREAYVTARLEHPGIVPVHQLGVDPEGQPFYAMKYIAGRTLEDAIRDMPKGDTPEANYQRMLLIQRVYQACQAVAFAHTRGVIHRDLKPGNIMLGDFGETVVVDWGLAKEVEPTDLTGCDEGCTGAGAPTRGMPREPVPPPPAPTPPPRPAAPAAVRDEPSPVSPLPRPPSASAVTSTPTQAGTVIGTPAYMPPEQARGEIESLGTTADVFSLGATLFEVATGRAPYLTDPQESALTLATQARYPQPRSLLKSVPRELEAIILRAMAPDPADRYPNACALAADLERYLTGGLVEVHRYTLRDRLRRWVRRHRVFMLVATLFTVATVAAALLVSGATLARSLLRSMVWIADSQLRHDLTVMEGWFEPTASALNIVEDIAVKHGADVPVARESLAGAVEGVPNALLLFYSYDGGSGAKPVSIGSNPDRAFPAELDPRDRPWYRAALDRRGGLAVVGPYPDVNTGLPTVTLSREILLPPDMPGQAVAGVDVNLSPLRELLRPTNLPLGGAVLVSSVDPTRGPVARWASAKPILFASSLPTATIDATAESAVDDVVLMLQSALSEGLADLSFTPEQAAARVDVDLTVDEMWEFPIGGKPHAVFSAPMTDLPWIVTVIIPAETFQRPFVLALQALFRVLAAGAIIGVALLGTVVVVLRRRERLGPDPRTAFDLSTGRTSR